MSTLVLAMLLGALATGPDSTSSPADPGIPASATRSNALRVFVDCQECRQDDLDFFRGDITFVDHVRDRAEAQVHVLITSNATGGGGDARTLTFIGRGAFAAMNDTLRHDARPAEAVATTRAALSQLMKLGLMRYVARTTTAHRIGISDAGAEGVGAKRQAADRWDSWVFRTRLNGYFNSQSSYRSTSLFFSQSAGRVTLASKVGFSVNGSYNENRFDLGNGTEIVSISRSRGANGRFVRSLADHWSAALRAGASTSTYDNNRLLMTVGPGLEYNLFPYTESTRRQLRFQYSLSYRHADYVVETIFDKTSESLLREGIEVVLDTREPWGSTSLSVEGEHYLHDFGKNRLRASGSVSLNVVQGLSINISGYAARPRDQLSLAKAAATPEEILLQRRQLATQFEYFVSVGVTYTFGSIFNSIVNARFGSGT